MILTKLVYDIINIEIKINNCPWFLIFKRKKYQKMLQEKKDELFKYNIFSIAPRFMNAVDAIGSANVENNNIFKENNIEEYKCNGYIKFNFEDTIIWYLVKSNKFEVIEPTVSYTIYDNGRISRMIESKWMHYIAKIKDSFYNSIISIADRCYGNNYRR